MNNITGTLDKMTDFLKITCYKTDTETNQQSK